MNEGGKDFITRFAIKAKIRLDIRWLNLGLGGIDHCRVKDRFKAAKTLHINERNLLEQVKNEIWHLI